MDAKKNEEERVEPRNQKPIVDAREFERYKTRWRRAKSQADIWIALLQAAYHYTVPQRNMYYWTSQTQGAEKNMLVYDTTPVAAVRNFVSKMQNGLTPPQQVWAKLKAGTKVPPEEKDRVDTYLQDTTDIIFNFLRHSNFDLAVNESYYDLAIGTAALCVHEGTDEDPLRFYSTPLARIAIEDSMQTSVETVFRWWDEIKIGDIMEMWPDAYISSKLMTMYKEDKSAVIKLLVEGTMYNVLETNPAKRYQYTIWHDDECLINKPLESSSWVVFRWSKTNNESMGRGPVIDALPAILSLNEIARLELQSANINVCRPIMAYSDGVFNPWTFRLQANTIIPVAPNANGQFPLQPFPDVANPAFAQLTSNDLRYQINTMLYNQPLGPVDAPPKTATEVALRQRNLAEEIGPLYTRLNYEFLNKLMRRIIYILQRKGHIEKLVIDGKEVQVEYQSPLIYAQGAQDVQTFLEFFQRMQGVVGPEQAIATINPTEIGPWMAEKLGVEMKLVNSKEGMQQMLEQLNQDDEQMKAAMMQQTMQGQGGQSATR